MNEIFIFIGQNFRSKIAILDRLFENLRKKIKKMSDEYGFPYDPMLEKKIQDSNDANSYGYIPEIPRLFLRSHIFGGSHVREERKVYVYNRRLGKLEKRVITTPKLEERLFLEILSNAIDNIFKSQRMGYQYGDIIISMTSDTFSIRSGGVPIPVDIHPYFYQQGNFGTCAELIFGVIGAGGNTNDSIVKQGGGQNGYGAKLVNVFARRFTVKIGDRDRGFYQEIEWRKNMMEKAFVNIQPSYATTTQPDQQGLYHIYPTGERYNGENFVEIIVKQDFRKFGVDFFTEDDLELYMKYAIEASFNAAVKIKFNDVVFDCRTAEKIVSMYPKDLVKNSLVHYEFFTPPQLSGKQLEEAIANSQIIPSVQLVVIDTPGEGSHISYCNGIYNVDGGEHTDVAYREVLKIIKETFQTNKNFDKGLDLSKINIGDLKKHATIIINYKCHDPVFKGQDKEKLLKPAPKINITIDEAAKMKKWNMITAIYTTLTGKHLKEMGGGKANKGRIKDDFHFRDANWFGTSRQGETVLIICEGNSAGSYILKWILATPERKDKYAVLLLRGKFKNVTDITNIMELLDNAEIKKFIEYMGFEFGCDYRIPQNLARLRYGYIYSMVDADSDGSHIQSLVMNFIYRVFPTFLMAQRFFYVPTPVIRVLTGPNGGTKHVFYNMFDYKKYVKSINGEKHYPKYFKGLAAGKDVYAAEDARISPIVYANFDSLAASAFDIAFKRGLTTERKKWIELWRSKIDFEILHQLSQTDPRYQYANISDYINTKLVEYSIDTFSRALPSYKDGLKKSQRQVLWFILTEWNFGNTNKQEQNIESIALKAKVESKYHHGDLTDTLARMSSNYPGSNNIPLMAQEGQFGTREHLGKDLGAVRYIETKPESIIKKIFDKELMDLIPRNVVENKDVEPKWIPSKIPLHIINGVIGLATAYSVEIPSYHPIDVILWIIQYITKELCFPIVPWFKGFTGIIELEIFKNKYKKNNQLLLENQEMVPYYEGLTLTTKGLYEVIRQRNQEYTEEVNGKKEKVTHRVSDILITEIPIGVGTSKYMFEMEKKCDKVEDKVENPDNPRMIIHGWKDEISHKSLNLIERTGLCNITLIDDDAIPIQMRNIYEALKLYCDNMMSLYELLKTTRLDKIKRDIVKETKIIKLIDLLRSKTIIDDDQSDEFIKEQMLKYEIEFEYYQKLGRRSTSKDGYNEHIRKLDKLKSEYSVIEERHYLKEWYDDLISLRDHFSSLPEYHKLQHHQYPFIPTKIEDLLTGKIKSPFAVKEEILPPSI